MKKKSLLVSSLAMLMISVIALTGASLAWFTNSRANTVGNMEFKVVSSAALRIALDPTDPDNFKTTLGDTDLNTIAKTSGDATGHGTYLADFYYNPFFLTGADAKELDAVTPKTDGVGSLDPGDIIVDTTAANSPISFWGPTDGLTATQLEAFATAGLKTDISNFMALHLFFKSSAPNPLNVWFDATTSVFDATAGTYPNNTVNQQEIFKSVRLGFVMSQLISSDGVSYTMDANTRDLIVFEPNTDPSAYAGQETGLQWTLAYSTLKDTGIAGGLELIDETLHNGFEMFEIQPTVEGTSYDVWQVTVYMWIEGNDLDCNNYVSGGMFKLGLGFYALDV